MPTIKIPNGVLTMAESFFNCPNCQFPIAAEDYHHRLERTPKINAKCPNCNTNLILTPNYKKRNFSLHKTKNQQINKALRVN